VRRLGGLLLATALAAAGCGGGGGASGADLGTVASAIREIEQKGAAFSYTDTLLDSGGSIPKGVVNRIRLSAVGQERDDNVSLVLSQLDGAGKAVGAYDLVINDIYLFVRPHGTTRDWFLGSAALFNQFYPGVRMNLLRETVLLAGKSSKGTSFSGGTFLNQYTITAAPNQLEQLMSTTVTPDKRAGFLKSASATITAYLTTSGHLQKLDLHVTGIEPGSSLKRVFDSSMTFSKVGKITDPSIPATAVPVQPVDMFSTGAAPTATP
jgi:hypothetical protein